MNGEKNIQPTIIIFFSMLEEKLFYKCHCDQNCQTQRHSDKVICVKYLFNRRELEKRKKHEQKSYISNFISLLLCFNIPTFPFF